MATNADYHDATFWDTEAQTYRKQAHPAQSRELLAHLLNLTAVATGELPPDRLPPMGTGAARLLHQLLHFVPSDRRADIQQALYAAPATEMPGAKLLLGYIDAAK